MKLKFKYGALLGLAFAATLSLSQMASAEMVINRGNASEPGSLDPAKQETVGEQYLSLDLFQGLTTYGPKGEVSPGAAEKWTVSDDGKTYTFTIRANAKWSNGEPLTAGDFVYSWLRALDPKTESPYAYFLDKIKGAADLRNGKTTDPATLGAKALDDKTLQVELENPTPYFLAMVRSPITFPVNKAAVEKAGDQWTQPANFVGNGAFKLTEWTPNSHITAVKNEHYWNAKNVKVDKVNYYPIEDEAEEFKKFRAGELDVTYTISPDQVDFAKKEMKDEYQVSPYFGTYYYQVCTEKAPFDNPKVRRALALAIDRDKIVKNVTKGGEIASYGWVPPGVPGYKGAAADFKKMSQKQRNAEAVKILKELGYTKENPLKLEILYNTSDRHKLIAVAIQDMWKAVNVDASLTNAEFKVVNQRRKECDFQVNRAGWIGDYVDPTTFAENFMIDSEQNDPHYKNQQYTDLVKGSNAIADPKARLKALADAEAILLKDLPILPIYTYVTQHMVSKKLKGWNFNILDYHPSEYLTKVQ